MKSLLSGFLVGTAAGCFSSWQRQQPQVAHPNSTVSSWPQQLKSITTQLKQDVIPTVKELQQTLSHSETQINADLQQIMNSTNELKQKLPKN
ncbi:MAG: hypothetical protein J6573_08270 [Lactobacillus sp.]|nr:hypothetical protein [Lactobacillus sp.]